VGFSHFQWGTGTEKFLFSKKQHMKSVPFFTAFFLLGIFCKGQDTLKIPALDKSPMDMSYWPDLYPILKFQGKVTGSPTARVIYGRPQRDGRVIFGELIRFNELWRMGANESTEIEFYQNVKIGGKTVNKGKYTLYCIPTPDEWTFIVNKDTDSWGAFKYDQKKDVVRVKVRNRKKSAPTEAFSIYFEKTTTGANMIVSWDTVSAALPISL
jgi:hypothetical protein